MREIAMAGLGVVKPLAMASKAKRVEANFKPSEKYSDSFIWGERKGGGFLGMGAPQPGSPITNLILSITLRPGVMGAGWVGYTIDIANPEADPKITAFREWPESGGEIDAPPEKLVELKPHILDLVGTPLTADGKAAPREAPGSMF